MILNAANSTVGQLILQLCQLLRLRAIGVVRRREQVKHQKLVTWLKSLGATEVIAEDEQIRVSPMGFCSTSLCTFDSKKQNEISINQTERALMIGVC